jgi:hypothetical protein
MKAQCSASQPQNPRSKKVAKYGIKTGSLRKNKNAMSSEAAHKSSCQFVYHGTVGGICRTQNNRDSIFSPPGHEPAIEKVPKYVIRDPHMLCKISCPYFI